MWTGPGARLHHGWRESLRDGGMGGKQIKEPNTFALKELSKNTAKSLTVVCAFKMKCDVLFLLHHTYIDYIFYLFFNLPARTPVTDAVSF